MFSTTFSNLGNIVLPKKISEYVEKIDFMLGQASIPKCIGACVSYKNKTIINLSKTIEDDVIETGSEIEIVISKGKLEMPKLDNVNDFTIWASQNNVKYEITYDYSATILKDDIIKCSHKQGALIKENDTVVITISKGKSITIPNAVTDIGGDAFYGCTGLESVTLSNSLSRLSPAAIN